MQHEKRSPSLPARSSTLLVFLPTWVCQALRCARCYLPHRARFAPETKREPLLCGRYVLIVRSVPNEELKRLLTLADSPLRMKRHCTSFLLTEVLCSIFCLGARSNPEPALLVRCVPEELYENTLGRANCGIPVGTIETAHTQTEASLEERVQLWKKSSIQVV